jgi:WD40 repeat protein/predicted Ser/Thr protein kinase
MKGVMNKEDADVTLESPRIEGPGTVIGRYKLLELIGEGGMGLVYLAEQQEPIRRRAALKIVKLGMDTKQVIARFEAEKQMLALLDHPNIARVYDAGTTEAGRPYFVMEYVKGQSITEYCDQHKTSIEDRLKLFRQVCEGVQHAHQKGIIHRDIKPSNILVTVEGDRAVPKIIDFGIAKAVTQQFTEGTLFTQQGQLLGTPEYMSPEQTDLATQDIDTRSDIYSLGVVLYQLLAGVLPFGRESFEKGGFAEIQRVIQEVDPPNPSTALSKLGDEAKKIAEKRRTQVVPLAKRLHRELEWIPLKAMRKERVRRYRSASELADDIQNYLNGNPLIAGPETAIYRVKKFVRRHAGSVATVILVSAAIILGLVISSAMFFRSERALQREAIARKQAEQAENVAQEQRNLAETKAEDLRRAMYVNNIQLADSKCREGNIRRVRELLDSCPNDLRGWEWSRLNYISDQSIMTLHSNQGAVHSVALSPDGKRIISGSSDTVKLWDAETSTEVMNMRGHTSIVVSVAFSPDGKQIASGSHDRTVRIWDASSGKELMTLRGHQTALLSVKFSPDGKRIVSGSYDKLIKVWDAKTGADVMTLHGLEINSVAFSPDGKQIVSGDVWGEIKVWDAVTGKEETTLRGYGYDNGWVPSISFSPDGKFIVSGWGNEIKIWNVSTGTEIMTLRGHDGPTMSVIFSKDGKNIVSGSMDNTIKVWDTATGKIVLTLRGHEGYVNSVEFTPDGKKIVSGSQDGTVKVWDLSIDRESTRIFGQSTLTSIVFSPDGKHIVSGSYAGEVKIWDVESGAELMTLRGHEEVFSIAFSSDGKRIVSGGVDKTISLWDAVTGTELMALRGHEKSITCVAFSVDNKLIVSGSGDKMIKVWDATTGAELMTLSGHKEPISSISFSPDGKQIISGSRDGTIKVWDVASGTEVMNLSEQKRGVACVLFSPDGKRIASASYDGTTKILDTTNGNELMTLRGHGGAVRSIAFNPDGKRIISGSMDRTVKVWDMATGTELLTLHANFDQVYSVAFSPDGKTIAGGDRAGEVVLYESTAPTGGYELRKTGRAATKFVDEMYQKYGYYYDVIDKIQADTTLDEPIRKLALQIANSRKWEDVDKLWQESWDVVSLPDKDMETYHQALEKIEKANSLETNNPNPSILRTLGVAQYRVGNYEDALKTLTKTDKIRTDANEPHPEDVAFIAMALHKLGRTEDAKATLERLRTLLKDERFADDQQAKSFLLEAEQLITPAPPKENQNKIE